MGMHLKCPTEEPARCALFCFEFVYIRRGVGQLRWRLLTARELCSRLNEVFVYDPDAHAVAEG